MSLIVITFYSLSCFGRKTAKVPIGLRVIKLPPGFTHLSTAHGRYDTVEASHFPFQLLNVKQGNSYTYFYSL